MVKLAIIGASYLQMPLVSKANQMGLETHCFAWDEGAVCKDLAHHFYPISITEKDEILEICKKIGINGICSIASDVAVNTVAYVAEKLNLITNSTRSAVLCTNKYLMRKRFYEYNVASPMFCKNNELEQLSQLRYPVIVKPTDRSGSLGVLKVENKADLNKAIERASMESFEKAVIIEEYIRGAEVSVETISWEGKHFILAITDKETTGEPYFVELAHHQPSLLSKDIQEKIEAETIKALNALEIRYGASHAEFKITEDGEVFAIETGARMGGDFIGSDLVLLSTGFDFVEAVINISLGKFTQPELILKKSSGVYFLSEQSKFLLPLMEDAIHHPEIMRMERTNSVLKNIQCSADRSGYLIYQSDKKFIP